MKAYLTAAALVATSFLGGIAHADTLYNGEEQPPVSAVYHKPAQQQATGVSRAQVLAELAADRASGGLNDPHEQPAVTASFPQKATQASYAAGPAWQATRNN